MTHEPAHDHPIENREIVYALVFGAAGPGAGIGGRATTASAEPAWEAAGEEIWATVARWHDLFDPAFQPAKTERGKRLRALRRRVLESGEPLLDIDEINRFLGRGDAD